MADNNLTTKEEFLLNPVEEHNITDAAIASFETNLKHPLKVTVPITPIQDLHGMPNPYPAGASVNLIPDGTDTSNGYVSGYYLKNDGTTASSANYYVSEYFGIDENTTYTYASRGNTEINPSICFYDENKQFISGINVNKSVQTFTPPAGAVYARASQSTYNYQSAHPTSIAFQLEVSSTATEYRRYSNICPIEGISGITDYSSGKNFFDYSKWDTLSKINAVPGQYHAVDVPVPDGVYTVHSQYFNDKNGHGFYANIGKNASDKGKSTVASSQWMLHATSSAYRQNTVVVNVTGGHLYINIYCPNDNTLVWLSGLQVESGSVPTEYVPYRKQDKIPITFTDPSTGDPMTVYGGSLTLNEDGSADVVSNYNIIDLGNVTYNTSYASSGIYRFNCGGGATAIVPATFAGQDNKLYCSHYLPFGAIPAAIVYDMANNSIRQRSDGSTHVYVKDTRYINYTSAQFASAVSGVQLCYPLATPTIYHFSNVGQLKAFLGENNVWSDIGNVNVKYLTQHSETGLEYRGDRALELRRRAMMADAPTIHTTVGSEETGGLASFKSYVKAPVKKIEIPFSPKQDLHGYDHPWPGGVEKNKCNYLNPDDLFVATSSVNRSKTASIGEITIDGDTVTLTRTNSAAGFSMVFRNLLANTQYYFHSVTEPNNVYYFGKITWVDNDTYTIERVANNVCTFTTNDAGDYEILIWNNSTSDITVKNAQLELGSAATDYVPYENICPIEGYDNCEVKQQGKNLFDINNNPSESLRSFYGKWLRGEGYNGVHITINEDTITFVHGKDSALAVLLGYFKADSGPFYVSESEITGSARFNIIARTESLVVGAASVSVTSNRLFYPETDGYYWASYGNYPSGDPFTVSNIQLEAKTEATDYESYKQAILPFIFNQTGDHTFLPTQEGTGDPSPENVRSIHPGLTFTRDDDSVLSVYGGTLTVNADGSSNVVADSISYVANGTEPWVADGSHYYINQNFSDFRTGSAYYPICSHFVTSGTYISAYGKWNVMKTSVPDITSATDFKSWVVEQYTNNTPLTCVYPLAEPVTYTLSVTETNRALEALGLTQHIGPLYGGTITINPDGSADVASEYLYLVSTGTESWAVGGTQEGRYFYRKQIAAAGVIDVQEPMYCSHLPYSNITATNTIIGIRVSGSSAYGGDQLYVRPYWIAGSSDRERITQFQTWLADQYANGTPVVIAQKLTNADQTYHFSNLDQLKVWLGENNFWCDISDDITVKYWNRG